MHYLNKAWLAIYLKQIRDYPKDKKPQLLIVVKDHKEWSDYTKIMTDITEDPSCQSYCFFVLEWVLKEWCNNKVPLINCGFTDCLISYKINDCLLKDYISKNLRRK